MNDNERPGGRPSRRMAQPDASSPPAQRLSRPSLLLHGGRPPASSGAPVVTPLSQSVNYVLPYDGSGGVRYGRYGNTPNAALVQRRLALLEGAEDALILSSGMAATTCTMLALLRPGDHVV